MSKRVTIVIDTEIDKTIRRKQANLILDDGESHSYSQVLNDILRKGLK